MNEGKDILTEALGTPEHRGRVRGVGEFVTPSVYYNVAREKSKLSQQPQSEASSVKTEAPRRKQPQSDASSATHKKSKGKDVVREIPENKEVNYYYPCWNFVYIYILSFDVLNFCRLEHLVT